MGTRRISKGNSCPKVDQIFHDSAHFCCHSHLPAANIGRGLDAFFRAGLSWCWLMLTDRAQQRLWLLLGTGPRYQSIPRYMNCPSAKYNTLTVGSDARLLLLMEFTVNKVQLISLKISLIFWYSSSLVFYCFQQFPEISIPDSMLFYTMTNLSIAYWFYFQSYNVIILFYSAILTGSSFVHHFSFYRITEKSFTSENLVLDIKLCTALPQQKLIFRQMLQCRKWDFFLAAGTCPRFFAGRCSIVAIIRNISCVLLAFSFFSLREICNAWLVRLVVSHGTKYSLM